MNIRERRFVDTVWQYYQAHGRHDLPWRQTTDPYHILVSEMMLQQTQVSRVLPKYEAFVKRWPTAKRLASASLAEVLKAWQGLGYNRRAKLLHQCVCTIIYDSAGNWPKTQRELLQLPGVGPYTAGAVMAFAYNEPVSIIETNIRTVYLYHFFKNTPEVSESELEKLIAKTLDTKQPREWYWALMDYGAYLKQVHGNQNHRSKSYAKQSRFKGSDREIRGAIIRALSQGPKTIKNLESLGFTAERIEGQVAKLLSEGLLDKRQQRLCLPH